MAGLAAGLAEPIRYVLDWGRRYTLWTLHLGLACCAVEFVAASVGRPDLIRLGVAPATAGPDRADLLVVAGTVTDVMAPAILDLYGQLAQPRYVISFGACANTGGPYWDSYSVTKGVDQLIPVDIYVPGCPPRPEALRQAIARLHEQLSPPQTAAPRPVEALTAPLVRPGH